MFLELQALVVTRILIFFPFEEAESLGAAVRITEYQSSSVLGDAYPKVRLQSRLLLPPS